MAGLVDDETMSSGDVAAATQRAVDDDALLEGEDPASTDAEDMDHWISAYTELIAFKESLLNRGKSEIAEMSNPDSKQEAGEVDMTILGAELDRFRRRLRYWERRRGESNPGS